MDLLCVDELFSDDGSCSCSCSCKMIAAIDQTQLEIATAADNAAALAEEDFAELLQKEEEGMPKRGYASMYQQQHRDDDSIINVQERNQAVAWMVDVSAEHGLSAQAVVRSITYLDRFLSTRPLRPRQEPKIQRRRKKKRNNWWWLRLVQVSCLSLAIKLEETHMPLPLPLLLELQRNEPLIFHGSTVARMELLVASSLRWRLMTPTPLSFMSYFINQNHHHHRHLHSKAEALVIAAMAAAVQLTEQRPSAVAAAAAIGVELELPLWLPNSIKKTAYQCFLIMTAANIGHLQFGSHSHSHGDAQTVTLTAQPESPVAVLQLRSCSDSASDDEDCSSCVCQSKCPQIHHPR